MKRYWLGIAFGALGVFAAGLLVYGVGHRGVHMVEHTLASADPISIPLALVPFRLSGDEIGRIRRVAVFRSAPRTVRGVRLAVDLNQEKTEVLDRVRACRVIAEGLESSGHPSLFRCFDEASDASEAYVPFGEVHFAPAGLIQPLLVSARDMEALARELDQADPEASGDPDAQDVVAEIKANSSGVAISVWDALREAGLRLKADSSGAVLQIADQPGGSRILLRADSHGLVVSAAEGDSSAVQLKADSSGFMLNVRERGRPTTVRVESGTPAHEP